MLSLNFGGNYYNSILKKIKTGSSQQCQILCANCNAIKKIESEEQKIKNIFKRGREVASRQAHNLEVAGSNPAPAIWQGSSAVEHTLHKRAVTGSIPVPAIFLFTKKSAI